MRQPTSDKAIDRVPRWSPDAAWITAFSNRNDSLQIWKIRPDGSDLQAVTQVIQAGVHTWSPDGRRLAATVSAGGSQPATSGHAMIFDVSRPAAEQTPERLPDGLPPDPRFVPNSWSADGRWIAGQTWYGIPGINVYSVEKRTYERVSTSASGRYGCLTVGGFSSCREVANSRSSTSRQNRSRGSIRCCGPRWGRRG